MREVRLPRRAAGACAVALLVSTLWAVPPARAAEQPPSVAADEVSAIGSLLREVQQAAEDGDRDLFDECLADARRAAGTLPEGSQKRAVNAVLEPYVDLARVWGYSFASPTGAFFDATTQGGTLLKKLRGYAGYEERIAPKIVGGSYYPTRETREFLVALAAKRLGQVSGVPQRVPPRESGVPAARFPVA